MLYDKQKPITGLPFKGDQKTGVSPTIQDFSLHSTKQRKQTIDLTYRITQLHLKRQHRTCNDPPPMLNLTWPGNPVAHAESHAARNPRSKLPPAQATKHLKAKKN
jgi:hypothetical protein